MKEDGTLVETGDIITRPKLAKTLSIIADDPTAYYDPSNQLAQDIVADIQDAGNDTTVSIFASGKFYVLYLCSAITSLPPLAALLVISIILLLVQLISSVMKVMSVIKVRRCHHSTKTACKVTRHDHFSSIGHGWGFALCSTARVITTAPKSATCRSQTHTEFIACDKMTNLLTTGPLRTPFLFQEGHSGNTLAFHR